MKQGAAVIPHQPFLLVSPEPLVNIHFRDGCKGDDIIFSATEINAPGITNWNWDFGDGQFSHVRDTSHIYIDTGTFKIQLTVVAASGCSILKDSSIQIFGTTAFAGNDTVVAANQPVQLHAVGGNFYKWSPDAGLNNDTIFNPVATLSSSQRYNVTVNSLVGCPSTASIYLKVYDGPEIYVPKAFTPNGDSKNDLLRALPVGMRLFKNFTVFNRYGEIVFATTNSSNAWDGIYKGRLQNAGVYVWIASAVNYKGVEILRRGTVMLLR